MRGQNEEEDKLLSGLYYQIGKLHAEQVSASLPGEEALENLQVPETLDTWFQQLVLTQKQQERAAEVKKWGRMFSRRAAVIFVLILTGLSLTTLTVEAFRVKLFNFVTEVKEKYTQVDIQNKSAFSDQGPGSSEGVNFKLEFVPEGYVLSEQKILGQLQLMFFTDGDGRTIEVSKSPAASSYQLNTEGAQTKRLNVGDSEGILVERNGQRTLLWMRHADAYYIIGELSESEILRMAQSIIEIP